LDRVAAASLIPGPSSTEVGIFIGRSLRGWTGLIVAGSCFIIPAGLQVSLIAAADVRYCLDPGCERHRNIRFKVNSVVVDFERGHR
jgi:chromate transporter